MAEVLGIVQFCFSVTEAGGRMDFIMEPMLLEICVFIFFPSFSSSPLPLFFLAYSTFYIVGLILSMQIPFVGFQPIRTSEHMAAAGKKIKCLLPNSLLSTRKPQTLAALFPCIRKSTY